MCDTGCCSDCFHFFPQKATDQNVINLRAEQWNRQSNRDSSGTHWIKNEISLESFSPNWVAHAVTERQRGKHIQWTVATPKKLTHCKGERTKAIPCISIMHGTPSFLLLWLLCCHSSGKYKKNHLLQVIQRTKIENANRSKLKPILLPQARYRCHKPSDPISGFILKNKLRSKREEPIPTQPTVSACMYIQWSHTHTHRYVRPRAPNFQSFRASYRVS